MNIKDQVLSIDQVQELIELGFDIKENTSMVWVKLFDHNNFYRILNKEYAEYIELNDYIPTMSIGDILNILPERVHKNYYLEIGKCYAGYYCEDHISLNREVGEKLIDSLFEILKWCIKENYIDKEFQFN